ncbi:TVP38/TMEM64 family protein [Salipaludibacillus aurantiacus]|uniref:TVP38/TMEM64 family membrane protein n=1 Tax=Salipaludibacillus aurantiacus TaxID=1601833 RepID=A0A1H9W4H7_9BACI|nr:TVP38/TMEM64 family protein [Salipaludibacillus aurantiacus]SES28699.1 Uncharacterized membrane protein YdjX, TVP38/TMEM64 family, SNARE-associated domain [Salipaludibacillus aurantiacus]
MPKKSIIKWVAVILLIGFLFWFNSQYLNIRPQEIREWILGFGLFAPLIYILLYTVRPLILFPASVMTLAGGLAFGALWGTVLTVIGATGSAALAFIVARKLGKNMASKDWKGKGEKIQQQLENNGFYYILLLRFVPLFNFDMISYLAGISKVKFVPFILGTAGGMIPATFAYAFLGSSLLAPNIETVLMAIGFFVLITVISFLLNKKIKGKFGMQESNYK